MWRVREWEGSGMTPVYGLRDWMDRTSPTKTRNVGRRTAWGYTEKKGLIHAVERT